MKYMFYNPIELPEKVHIVSMCFGIDMTYDVSESNGKPVYFEQLFLLAQSESFDKVEIYLTSHNGAYYKKSKKAIEGFALTGWTDLKAYRNGGGYLEDKSLIRIKDETNE